MKSKPLTITLLLLILLGLAYMWPFKKIQPTSATPKITETKTFSCPGMEGFTFEYPVFEGWEAFKTEQAVTREIMKEGNDLFLKDPSHCIIPLQKVTNVDSGPRIEVVLSPDDGIRANAGEFNPNQVNYEDVDAGSPVNAYVVFYIYPAKIAVQISVLDVGTDFPKDLFFQTVIKSFKLTNN